MRKLVFCGNIAPVLYSRTKKFRVSPRVQGWCASKVRWCTGSAGLYISKLARGQLVAGTCGFHFINLVVIVCHADLP